MDFINLTYENIADEHLCCIIRKKPNAGISAKREWLSERLREGHVFRKLDAKGTVFIEYAPLEAAWTPIIGENYVYIYCLWVSGEYKGHGYGKALMEYCISDARKKGRSGICMLSSSRQKTWLSDRAFAQGFGFRTVDTTENGYELLALSFDGTVPCFAPCAKEEKIESDTLTVFYDAQCPYIMKSIEITREFCEKNGIPLSLQYVDSLEKAKSLPCVFNNFAVFYNGVFQTVNLLNEAYLTRLKKK